MTRARTETALLLAAALASGGCQRRTNAPVAVQRAAASVAPPAHAASSGRRLLEPGLWVERVRVAPDVAPVVGDGYLTLLRADPARFDLTLERAGSIDGALTADAWAASRGLVATVNASMFSPDGRSVGLMVDGAAEPNGRDHPAYGGFLAFGPRRACDPAVTLLGRSCAGFDLGALRASYRAVVQNYRLLDCDGAAIAWQDEKVYSAAVVGVDRAGRVVFGHARSPFTMTVLARALARPALEMAAAVFVEGGPEASLYARSSGGELRAIGSYETGFRPDDSNAAYWPLPNVLGLRRRAAR